jgi:hypothetical protein
MALATRNAMVMYCSREQFLTCIRHVLFLVRFALFVTPSMFEPAAYGMWLAGHAVVDNRGAFRALSWLRWPFAVTPLSSDCKHG